jgi:polar amino acid transport system substrate-binding protein
MHDFFSRRNLLIAGLLLWSQPLLAATDPNWQIIRQRGFIRVGVDPMVGPPYFFRSDGRNIGFELEILEAIAQKLQIKLEFAEIPWPEQIPALVAQKVDLVFNGHEQPVRNQNLACQGTRPYYISSQWLLLGSTKLPPKNFFGLAGWRVGVLIDSGGWALMRAFNTQRGNTVRLAGFQNLADLLSQLEKGKLDAVVLDTPIAVWQARQHPDSFRLAFKPLLRVPLVGLVRLQDNSLKEQLDDAISQLWDSGQIQKILKRWSLWNDLQHQL